MNKTNSNTNRIIPTPNYFDLSQMYQALGYAVVDDFLPEGVAIQLHSQFASEGSWEFIDQVREKHYQHVFKTQSEFLPRGEEYYLAKFHRSKRLEGCTELSSVYQQHIIPVLNQVSQRELNQFDVRCYKLTIGDFYRTHIDDYAGDVGFIYYLSKNWIWDWGGILHVVSNDNTDVATPIFPKFNRGIVIDHKNFRYPHFISPVSPYAKRDRYSIIGFNK